MIAIIGALGVAILAPFVVISYNRTGEQARAGAITHERSCRLYPISEKLFRGAEKYGIITAADLRVWLEDKPKDCP